MLLDRTRLVFRNLEQPDLTFSDDECRRWVASKYGHLTDRFAARKCRYRSILQRIDMNPQFAFQHHVYRVVALLGRYKQFVVCQRAFTHAIKLVRDIGVYNVPENFDVGELLPIGARPASTKRRG